MTEPADRDHAGEDAEDGTLHALPFDFFDRPPTPPPMVIDGLEPVDAIAVPGAGGTGKSTFEAWLAIHRITGRPVFGREILRPGPVVYVSGEDSRERIWHRLWYLVHALDLSRDERAAIVEGFFVEDLSANRWQLVEADARGNLSPTDLTDYILNYHGDRQPSAVILDPLSAFSPGERFVNDGEAAVMREARMISRQLGCAVRLVHHVGKAHARGGETDQYAGRGGSALADAARAVHVLTTHARTAGITGEDVAAGRILRLHVSKLTDAERPAAPFWIRRTGWRFDWLQPRTTSPAEREAAAVAELVAVLTTDAAAGVRHTQNTIERLVGSNRLQRIQSRGELRAALRAAMDQDLIRREPLPPDQKGRGGRTTYLNPKDREAQP
jgi:hypothetical protein